MKNEVFSIKSGNFIYRFDETGYAKLKGNVNLELVKKEDIIGFSDHFLNSSFLIRIKNRKPGKIVYASKDQTIKQNILQWLIDTMNDKDYSSCLHCGSNEDLLIYTMYYGYRKVKSREDTVNQEPMVIRFCNTCLQREQKENRRSFLSLNFYVISLYLVILFLSFLKIASGINLTASIASICLLILITSPVLLMNVKNTGKVLARGLVRNMKAKEGYNFCIEEDEFKRFPRIARINVRRGE